MVDAGVAFSLCSCACFSKCGCVIVVVASVVVVLHGWNVRMVVILVCFRLGIPVMGCWSGHGCFVCRYCPGCSFGWYEMWYYHQGSCNIFVYSFESSYVSRFGGVE